MHVLPGRIRIEVPWLKGNREKDHELESYLQSLNETVKATVNPRTARCLVIFDEGQISGHTIIKSIQSFTSNKNISHLTTKKYHKVNHPLDKSLPKNDSISKELNRVLAGGAVLSLFWSIPPIGPVIPSGLIPVASAALVSSGLPFFKRGWRQLKNRRKVNYDLMVSIISLVSALTGQGFWGLTTLWLANLSELAQKYALLKSAEAFSRALINKGTRIYIVQQNKLRPVLPGDVVPGDHVYFKGGDCVPVEGQVIAGHASVIPGEDVMPGRLLTSGTRIEKGSIVVRVSRVAEDTSLARLINILEDAVTKPDTGNDLATALGERMLPFTVISTIGIWAATGSFAQAVSVLLAGAPGAAGLAAPTAVSAAVSTAAGLGIAVKETKALEDLGHVDVVVFNTHKELDKYSNRGNLALKRLEEEGFKVEQFDAGEITFNDETTDKTEQEMSAEKSFIKKMQQNGLTVAWISGPNNPVVMNRADVNVMLLTGKEEKLYPAEVLCYGNDPRQVYRAIHIGRKTLYTIKQNVYLVQGINIAGQIMGVLGIVKWLPAAAINLTGVLAVVLNSARSLFWSDWALGDKINKGGTISGLKEKKDRCFPGNVEKNKKQIKN